MTKAGSAAATGAREGRDGGRVVGVKSHAFGASRSCSPHSALCSQYADHATGRWQRLKATALVHVLVCVCVCLAVLTTRCAAPLRVPCVFSRQVGAGGYSRLLTWRGSDPSLDPVLFISHYDVVPVTPGTEGACRWERVPVMTPGDMVHTTAVLYNDLGFVLRPVHSAFLLTLHAGEWKHGPFSGDLADG